MDTALQYYLKVDASAMTDREWSEKFAQLTYLRKRESGNDVDLFSLPE